MAIDTASVRVPRVLVPSLHPRVLSTLFHAAFLVAAAAQCPSPSVNPCAPGCYSQDLQAHTRNTVTSPAQAGVRVGGGNTIYVRWLPDRAHAVTGFSLRINSTSGEFVASAGLWTANSADAPASQVRHGAIGLASGFAWRRANFSGSPYPVRANTLYFISVDVPAGGSIVVERATQGGGPTFSVTYFVSPTGNTNNGNPTNDLIIYRISAGGRCPSASGDQLLVGQPSELRCSDLPATIPSHLWLSAASQPALAWPGSPGSFLCIRDPFNIAAVLAGNDGVARAVLAVPPIPALRGYLVFSQWSIFTSANPASFALSDRSCLQIL